MSLPEVRVGQGFDVHRFEAEPSVGRQLVLGGCVFEGERALVGHSDADVPAHAVADARSAMQTRIAAPRNISPSRP